MHFQTFLKAKQYIIKILFILEKKTFSLFVKIILSNIFITTIILSLPFSRYHPNSFLHNLFTATSAATLTGLNIHSPTWTPFGKFIILFNIQISIFLIILYSYIIVHYLLKGRHFENTNQNIGRFKDIFKNMLIYVIFIESIGFLFYFSFFIKSYPFLKSIEFSITYTLTSFGNCAQISLYQSSPYQKDIYFLLISGIISFIGLFGFFPALDIYQYFIKRRKNYLSISTKICIISSLSISFITFITLFFIEYNFTLKNHNIFFKIIIPIYESLILRGSGVNLLSFDQSNPATIIFLTLIMLIGGNPSGTAGGMKSTTFWVFLLSIRGIFLGRYEVEIYHRTLSSDLISRAFMILFSFLFLFITGSLIIASYEHGSSLKLHHITFQVSSALSNTGLSLQKNENFSNFSQIVLIFMMICGRILSLGIVVWLAKTNSRKITLPSAEVLVG